MLPVAIVMMSLIAASTFCIANGHNGFAITFIVLLCFVKGRRK